MGSGRFKQLGTAELAEFRQVCISNLRYIGTAELADFRQVGFSKLRHLGTAELGERGEFYKLL